MHAPPSDIFADIVGNHLGNNLILLIRHRVVDKDIDRCFLSNGRPGASPGDFKVHRMLSR
jgi:hypothetical protein